MSSVETGQMSAVEAGQMSAAETGQMSAVETGQMSAAETGQTSADETGHLSCLKRHLFQGGPGGSSLQPLHQIAIFGTHPGTQPAQTAADRGRPAQTGAVPGYMVSSTPKRTLPIHAQRPG